MTEAKKELIDRRVRDYRNISTMPYSQRTRWVDDIMKALSGKSIVFSDHPDWVYEVFLIIKKERECSAPTK